MEIKATSEALSFLYELSLNQTTLRFRGQANFSWPLHPSIYRCYDFQRYQTVEHEKNILQRKPLQPCPPLMHTSFDLEWLMLCQHYGVPTRLLDWSADILISLFFACSPRDQANSDGAIFICDHTKYQLFAAYEQSAMNCQELAFISTNIVNPRLRMQSGCFMLWGHAPLNNDSSESYDLWEYHESRDDSLYLQKICIPKNYKGIILGELESIYGISEESVYLKNGYLDNQFTGIFCGIKEEARLITLYTTDADRLSDGEKAKARSMNSVDCRDMYKGCVNLRMIGI
jgi:hypothetical protein